MQFEVYKMDYYLYDGEWVENAAYLMGSFKTVAKNKKVAFSKYLDEKHRIKFKKNNIIIETGANAYTIIDRKTKKPLYSAIEI